MANERDELHLDFVFECQELTPVTSPRWKPLLIVAGMFLLNVDGGGATFSLQSASAQEEQDEIETDRDSFTPATSTVGSGRSVLESAYTFIDNRSVEETHSFPELLLRRGVSDWLELRIGANYEVGGAGNPVSGNSAEDIGEDGSISENGGTERESRVFYGAKARVSEQSGWTPMSAVLVQGYTPTSGELTATDVSAGYVFGWTLSGNSVWDSAIRYSTSSVEGDRFNVWAPSTVLKVPVGERWKAHVEYFGIFSDGRAAETTQHFASPGIHYLINPNLEVGVRVGWGLNQQSPNFFSNSGFGWRY